MRYQTFHVGPISLLVAVLVILSPAIANAFRCEPPTIEQAYKDNDVVFIGRVISAKVVPEKNLWPSHFTDIDFEVIVSWKGVTDKTLSIDTNKWWYSLQPQVIHKNDMFLVMAHAANSEHSKPYMEGCLHLEEVSEASLRLLLLNQIEAPKFIYNLSPSKSYLGYGSLFPRERVFAGPEQENNTYRRGN